MLKATKVLKWPLKQNQPKIKIFHSIKTSYLFEMY